MNWTEIEERMADDVIILDLQGQATVWEGRGRLFRRIVQLLDQGRNQILLNLLHLPYIDSQGLGDIVQGYKAAAQRGGSLKLCEVHERIRELLTLTRLVAVIETFDSEEQALQAFRDSRDRPQTTT